MKPTRAQVYTYFRLALVTGLLELPAVIEWADRQILDDPGAPDHGLIELSLAANRSLSQVAGLLNHFQAPPGDELPLYMLLARAGILLEAEPSRAVEIIQGLRLLLAEEKLPRTLRTPLRELDAKLSAYRQSAYSVEELESQLSAFLAGFADARARIPE